MVYGGVQIVQDQAGSLGDDVCRPPNCADRRRKNEGERPPPFAAVTAGGLGGGGVPPRSDDKAGRAQRKVNTGCEVSPCSGGIFV